MTYVVKVIQYSDSLTSVGGIRKQVKRDAGVMCMTLNNTTHHLQHNTQYTLDNTIHISQHSTHYTLDHTQ